MNHLHRSFTWRIEMESAKKELVKKTKKLGFTKLTKNENAPRSGCAKSHTNDCGIYYRNG